MKIARHSAEWESGKGVWEGEMGWGVGWIQFVCECQSTSLMGESWLLWPTVSESQNLFGKKLYTKEVFQLCTVW